MSANGFLRLRQVPELSVIYGLNMPFSSLALVMSGDFSGLRTQLPKFLELFPGTAGAAGSWEPGAGSQELGAGSWEPGAGSQDDREAWQDWLNPPWTKVC